MAKIKSIKFIGQEDVYNMEVKDFHNYSVNGGLIIHNCESIRYGIMSRPRVNGDIKEKKQDDFLHRDKPDSFELDDSYINMNVRGR